MSSVEFMLWVLGTLLTLHGLLQGLFVQRFAHWVARYWNAEETV